MIRQSLVIAIVTCICLVFVGSALANIKSLDNDPTHTTEQAIAPYVEAMGCNPDEVRPGMTTQLLWGRYNPVVLVVQHFGGTGWRVVAFYQQRDSALPPEWVVLAIIAMRQREPQNRPTDPWGRPLSGEALYPEIR